MDQTTLQILVQLKDEASAAFKKLGNGIETAANSMGGRMNILKTDVSGLSKVLAGLAVGAGAATVAFLYSSVKAGAEAEAQMARVTASLESMGEEALRNRNAILKAADATVKLGFDDEDAALSITKFYQRTRDMNQALNLNSIAMDLARAKHIDLSSAVNMVNMVLSGQGKVLAQYGINIKDSATPLEALGMLQKEVAGQADAFSKTFQGQMEILSLSFNNMKEVIGSVLIEALMPFITQFTNWLNDPQTKQQFAFWTAEFKSWAEVIIPTLVETFKIWIGVLTTVFDMLVKIGNIILSVIENLGRINQRAGQLGFFGSGIAGLTNFGHMLGFAEGGIVTRPTLAMIGEAGESEAVIPLSKLENIGGRGVTINLIGTFYTEEESAERYANHIANVVGQQVKIRTI